MGKYTEANRPCSTATGKTTTCDHFVADHAWDDSNKKATNDERNAAQAERGACHADPGNCPCKSYTDDTARAVFTG